jgi:peptidoglycan/LPS O-acetylase OafA/YrhL
MEKNPLYPLFYITRMRYSTLSSIIGMLGASFLIIAVFLPFYHYNGVDVPLSNGEITVGFLYAVLGTLGLIVVKESPSLSWIFGIAGFILLAFILPPLALVPGYFGLGPGFLILGSALLLAASPKLSGKNLFQRKTEE